MAKLTRLEEVAQPVVLLGQSPDANEPHEVTISGDQLVQLDPGVYAAREGRGI